MTLIAFVAMLVGSSPRPSVSARAQSVYAGLVRSGHESLRATEGTTSDDEPASPSSSPQQAMTPDADEEGPEGADDEDGSDAAPELDRPLRLAYDLDAPLSGSIYWSTEAPRRANAHSERRPRPPRA